MGSRYDVYTVAILFYRCVLIKKIKIYVEFEFKFYVKI